MPSKILKNKPLVEAILEVKWALTSPAPGVQKEARALALSILQAAEESRLRFAEEEAARGISWEEQS